MGISKMNSIDTCLFDQLLRGRIQPGMRILDAGLAISNRLHNANRVGLIRRRVSKRLTPPP
jgi:hypothetical protein